MAVERLNLKARWSGRRESASECASRAVECLEKLRSCDEAFAGAWLKCGNSRKSAMESRIDVTLDSLRTLFERGRNRRDTDKTVIEELGFSSGRLWNGWEKEAATHVAFNCGAYPDPAVLPGPNDCMVEFPYGGHPADRLLRVEKLRLVMRIVVESWDPYWARITSDQMQMTIYPGVYRGQVVGWLTYVSDRYGALPKLPDDCEATRIEGFGSLIVVKGIDQLTASNPAHVGSLRRLSEALGAAGLLAPMPPAMASVAW